MKKIRLILIEDNRLLREGIIAMLKKETDISVVAAFDDTDFSTENVGEFKPDVILLDIGLTNKDSLELVKILKSEYKDLSIIIMDLLPIQEDIIRFIEIGVAGFILKDATLTELTNTIRTVASGEKVLPAILAGSLFSKIMEYGVKEMGQKKMIQSVRMTNREREIVELIAQGLANKEIANQLNLSVYTVKSHVHNILEKMALNSRVQIALYAQSEEK
ncbi:response regulator transcription factor [soil metagenome]